MDTSSKRSELIAVLTALPQRELVDVLNDVLSRRVADATRPDFEEVKLVVAEAYRARDNDGCRLEYELLVLASPAVAGAFVTNFAPTQEGSCCGVTLRGYVKSVVCPLCGKSTNLT
jgi:hypothetical protein